ASCGGSPWFPVREVGPGNPILSDSTGEPPPSTFNYAWDIAGLFPVVQLYTTVPLECHRRAAGIEVRLMASSMNPLMFVKP
ncbi:hypothetical protein QZM64_41860, partial [Burkholderia cepacia]|uniref:hypothetical protein n=1 Tax=Burkholderia cepacia TaxID=292 RepID=UPI002651DAF6